MFTRFFHLTEIDFQIYSVILEMFEVCRFTLTSRDALFPLFNKGTSKVDTHTREVFQLFLQYGGCSTLLKNFIYKSKKS